MYQATFLNIQLNSEEFADSGSLVDILNNHLLFAAEVAQAADNLIQLARITGMTGNSEPTVELNVLAVERLREALDILGDFDSAWHLVLDPGQVLCTDIASGHRTLN